MYTPLRLSVAKNKAPYLSESFNGLGHIWHRVDLFDGVKDQRNMFGEEASREHKSDYPASK